MKAAHECRRKKNRTRLLPDAVISSALLVSMLITGCGNRNSQDSGSTQGDTATSVLETEAPDTRRKDITLAISEVMTANKTSLSCSATCFPDWVEIYNYGEESVSTVGLYLSDDENNLCKWAFPNQTIQPGEYLIVLCDDGIESDCGYLRADFKLNRDGCGIYLSDSVSAVESVTVPELDDDQSYLPEKDEITREVTPGYSNDEAGREDYLSAHSCNGALTINEVAVYNDSYNYIMGCYPDWVELKNCSAGPVLLSEYSICDGISEDKLRQLPEKTLEPGELFVIYLVGEDNASPVCSNCLYMSLNASGEQLYLFHNDGTLSDCIGIYNVPLRGTAGRMESCNGVYLFSEGSPGKDNHDGCRSQCAVPSALTAPGCYDDVESITVELAGEGDIYYTLDGKAPDYNSTLYTSPIVLDKTTVIRTFCSSGDKLDSKSASYSYFINEDFELPVVSITADRFKKVYYQVEESCDANIAYYGDDGSFSKDCKFELHGTSARNYEGKRSYKVTFSDRYGGDLEYNVFGNEQNTSFHSLVIRGSQVACAEIHLFRDSLVSLIANKVYPEDTDPLTLDSRYCILYVNGEYWGLHALREAYSQAYSANHLGGSEDDYIIGRPPFSETDEAELLDLLNWIARTDMSVSENYSKASQQMDMRSMALWYCMESYFNNMDSGNIRFTCNSNSNGRWYVMLYDFDIAMTNKNAQWIWIIYNDTSAASTLKSLLKSPEFCELLLSSAAELREGGLSDALIRDTVDELVTEVSHDMPRNLSKWKIKESDYNNVIDSLLTNFEDGRIEMWVEELQKLVKADDDKMSQYFPDIYS